MSERLSDPEFRRQAMVTVSLQCEGCDATFDGKAVEAFSWGWDCPPWYPNNSACPNCLMITSQDRFRRAKDRADGIDIEED